MSDDRQIPRVPIRVVSDAEVDSAFEPYVAGVGRVAYAWNYLHEKLGEIFLMVVNPAEIHIVLSVWYSTENDRAQREMLRAALCASSPNRWSPRLPTARDDLLWLVQETHKLADARNNAIHTPCSTFTDEKGTEMQAAFRNGHPRAKRLVGKRLIDELKRCERRTRTLAEYATRAHGALTVQRRAWPDKPALPIRGRKNSPQDQRRQDQPEEPPRPRPPSRR